MTKKPGKRELWEGLFAREYVVHLYRDLAGMTKTLNRIDQAKEAVEGSKLSDEDKQTRLQAIEKARGNLLSHADGMNKLLFDRRQKAAAVPQVGKDAFSPMLATPQSPYAPAPRTP
jgi:hypothetical protein